MFKISDSKAEKIIQDKKIQNKEKEQHYVFGRNGIYSFEEDESIYSVVEKGGKTFLVHEYTDKNEKEREISRVEKNETVEFLEKTGHEPFMKLDIQRYVMKDGTRIEKVDKLGYFTDSEELGEEETWYGNKLKEKMKRNQKMQEKVKEKAEKILNKS